VRFYLTSKASYCIILSINNKTLTTKGLKMELHELGLERRWDDLVDFVQKGRWLHIYQKGTDGLQDKIEGRGPWYTYKTQEWSNEKQCWEEIPKITYTWSADDVRKHYNERMHESWVMSHACDF